MISIKMTGQGKVLTLLEKLKRINNVVKLWMDSGEVDQIMNDSFAKNFRSQGRPKWDSLAQVTKDTRFAKGFGKGPILHQTGNMMDEVTSMKGKVSSSFGGFVKEWGADQLRGTERKKFVAHQGGIGKSGQKLPQRQMIGFQPADAKSLKRSLGNWLSTQIQ